MTEKPVDAIIVGLGCAGLGAAFYLSRMGLKVLGLERNYSSGAFGTSSCGETRIWRRSNPEKMDVEMMDESLALWKEIERETGEKIMIKTGMLIFGNPEKP